jgi:hypothetical protein
MGLSGEAVMVSSDFYRFLGIWDFLTDAAIGCGVVVVYLRIHSGRAAIGSQDRASAAEAHHHLGHLSGALCARLSGADHM